jgi:hypothetical protein
MDRKDIMTLSDKVALSIVNHASDLVTKYHTDRQEKYHILEVEKSQVPNGAKLIECYETDKEYIILGSPLNEEHNCDEMGCSTVSHVRMRISKKFGEITNEIELKPCPFCGGIGMLEPEPGTENKWWLLGCGDNKCQLFDLFSFPSGEKESYIEKWNTRK